MRIQGVFLNDRGKAGTDNFTSVVKRLAVAVLLAAISSAILANEQDVEEYINGEIYFNEQEFSKALPLLKDEAKKGSKPAMYRLAHMYRNGLGVQRDDKQAAYWYQQAASHYSYILTMDSKADEEKKSITQRLSDQIDPATNKEGADYALQKMDTTTPETRNLLQSFIDGDFFGLQPYETNFVLPVAYATHKYRRISSSTHYNNYTPEELEKRGSYDKNTEVQFQISLRKPITYNLFGWNESIDLAYTQKVWWQLYSDSGPFRETNYLPDIFMLVPTSESIDELVGLKSAKFGFLHESNGQEGYRSRSWNRFYLTGIWQWDNLFLATRAWYRLPEDKKYDGYYDGAVNPDSGVEEPNASGDDNPDMQNYLGYGDIKINYLHKRNEFGALFRYNLGVGGKNRGAIDLHWSYPFFNSENTFWYVKFFSGYGESLIDYDRSVTKAAFGFSFSRGLF